MRTWPDRNPRPRFAHHAGHRSLAATLLALVDPLLTAPDRTGVWAHTPDIFARLADGTGRLIDVKNPEHLSRPDVLTQARRSAEVCAVLGWEYQMVGDVDPQRWANVSWLAGFRRPLHAAADDPPAVQRARSRRRYKGYNVAHRGRHVEGVARWTIAQLEEFFRVRRGRLPAPPPRRADHARVSGAAPVAQRGVQRSPDNGHQHDHVIGTML